MLCAQENGFRYRVAVGQYKKYKIMLGSGSELSGVRVWWAGPFFLHTLKLWFKRQIFMIFIVDYIYQKGFLKSKNFKFMDNPFQIGQYNLFESLLMLYGRKQWSSMYILASDFFSKQMKWLFLFGHQKSWKIVFKTGFFSSQYKFVFVLAGREY